MLQQSQLHLVRLGKMMHLEPGNAVICAELGVDAEQDSASSLLESPSLPILTLPLGNIPFQNHLMWQSPCTELLPALRW